MKRELVIKLRKVLKTQFIKGTISEKKYLKELKKIREVK